MNLPFIDTNVTVNQLIAIFNEIATEHAQINSFGYGQYYDINAVTVENYPLLWVWVQPSKISNQSMKFVFRAAIMDLVNPEGTGVQQNEVQSDTINTLWDIAFLLRDFYDLQVTFDISATPFTEQYNDRVSGWYVDFNIEVPQQFGICDAPFKSCVSGNTNFSGPYPYDPVGCGNCLVLQDSSTIHFSGSGTTCDPLSAYVILSQRPGNGLIVFSDGLYSSGGTGSSSSGVTHSDSSSIALSGAGSVISPLVATSKVSALAGNSIAIFADGLYSSGTTSANNGLTDIGGVIKLGGKILQNTNIDLSGGPLTLQYFNEQGSYQVLSFADGTLWNFYSTGADGNGDSVSWSISPSGWQTNLHAPSFNSSASLASNIFDFSVQLFHIGGTLKINDGSDGTVGYVLTTVDTVGTGHWVRLPNVSIGGISNRFGLDAGWSTLDTFGDSFTLGANVPTQSLRYVVQLSGHYGLFLNNFAVDGGTTYTTVAHIFQQNYLSATRNNVVTNMSGTNDILHRGSQATLRNKILGLNRTALANLFLKSVKSFSDVSVTRVGFTNSTVDCQDKSSIIGGTLQASAASGNTLSFSFTGDNLVIGTFATSPGFPISGWRVVIDGVNGPSSTYWREYNGSQYFASNDSKVFCPDVVVIRGLTNSTHTVVITAEGANTYLDYFGVLDTPANSKPVVFSSIPYVDENLYLNYATTFNPNFNSDAAVLSRVIRDACTEFFDYPLSFFDVNKFYFAPTMVQRPDNLHPGDAGQTAIYNGFISAITVQRIEYIDDLDVFNLSSFNNDLFVGTNGVSVSGGTVSGVFAKADSITTGVARFLSSDFNDNGLGLISIDYVNGQIANASQNGFLSSADWRNFNNATSGGTVSLDVIQSITAGSSTTATNGVNILLFNPSSTLSSYSLTLPAVPHNSNRFIIHSGGTLTSGLVVSSLQVIPNSGQTIIDNTPPGSTTTDDTIIYDWIPSLSTWYRVKL